MELDGISHKKDRCESELHRREKRAGSCKIMTYCGFPYPRLMWPLRCIIVVLFTRTSTR